MAPAAEKTWHFVFEPEMAPRPRPGRRGRGDTFLCLRHSPTSYSPCSSLAWLTVVAKEWAGRTLGSGGNGLQVCSLIDFYSFCDQSFVQSVQNGPLRSNCSVILCTVGYLHCENYATMTTPD